MRSEPSWSVVAELTKVGASHEVVAGVLGVVAAHLPGHRVEPGEVGSMEAVVVLHPAQGRGAGGEVLPRLGLHCLCANVKDVDLFSCWRENGKPQISMGSLSLKVQKIMMFHL